MAFNVSDDQNFCRVFMLPREFSRDYCFGGGHPTNFQEVDWFNPVPDPTFMEGFDTWEKCKDSIIEFMKQKQYYQPDRTYLVLTYFGECFTFGANLQR